MNDRRESIHWMNPISNSETKGFACHILSFWRKKTPIQMAAMEAAMKSISIEVENF